MVEKMNLLFLLFICTTSLLSVKGEQSNEFINFAVPNTETFLTNEDFENAKKHPVEEKGKIDDSAMYSKDLFEGDIVNPELNVKGNAAAVLAADSIMRNAIKNGQGLWPNARIPYTISAQFSAASRQVMASAFAEYAAKTCLRLVPKQAADKNYVAIQPLRGCYSYIGNINRGAQNISLGNGCVHKGIIIHEIMHAAGFWHEQSRNDRDNYVTIHLENVYPGFERNFQKGGAAITHLDTSYDYGSLMHYGPKDFSKNGQNTITPKQAGVTIGQRIGLSKNDALKLNRLYKCTTNTTTTTTTPSTTTPPTPSTTTPSTPSTTTPPTPSTTTPPTPSTTTPPIANCRDTNRFCRYYQRVRLCTRSGWLGNWVRRVCKKTCNRCTPSTTTPPIANCRDTNRFCRYYQRARLCTRSGWLGNWVRRVCKKTCNRCGNAPVCRDTIGSRICNIYARLRRCKRSATVRRVCRKSCRVC